MHHFQIPILMPCPTKSTSLPDRQAFVPCVDSLMPASPLRQFHNPLLDKITLAFFSLRQFAPILGSKGGGLEQSIPSDDAADLVQRMRDLINETFGPATLDKARDLLLEAVVESKCVDDRGLAASARGRLAEENQVGGVRGGDGVFIVPADEMARWAPAFPIRDLAPDVDVLGSVRWR